MNTLEKEIDLIQSCINRMAGNSFFIKGWTVTLVAVILALLPEKVNAAVVSLILLTAAVCFWYLDAYYLRMERLYRWKYEWILERRESNPDRFRYDLNPMNREMWLPDADGNPKEPPSIPKVMVSETLRMFYGPVIAIILMVLCWNIFHNNAVPVPSGAAEELPAAVEIVPAVTE